MKKQYLEAGRIVNTHGIAGDVKVQPWCDDPALLTEFDTLFFAPDEPVTVTRSFVHKGNAVLHLAGIDSMEAADSLRGKVLYLDRSDVELPENLVFIQDILGLPIFDLRTQETIGILEDILPNPGHDLYVVRREGKSNALIPACKPFLKEVDLMQNRIVVETIEGLLE